MLASSPTSMVNQTGSASGKNFRVGSVRSCSRRPATALRNGGAICRAVQRCPISLMRAKFSGTVGSNRIPRSRRQLWPRSHRLAALPHGGDHPLRGAGWSRCVLRVVYGAGDSTASARSRVAERWPQRPHSSFSARPKAARAREALALPSPRLRRPDPGSQDGPRLVSDSATNPMVEEPKSDGQGKNRV